MEGAMDVYLDAIKFNHDPATAHSDAMNLRKNGSEFITVPEWRAGISINPEDSRAAYAKKEVAGNTLTIQARFGWLGKGSGSAKIRALDPTIDPPGPRGCLGFILWILRFLIRALFGNVLGEVKAGTVSFSGPGLGNFETFELINTSIDKAGVGMRTTTWRWQYKVGGGSWTDFATSRHRIYILLEMPHAPWQQTPYASSNTQLLWTDVLDRACNWAIFATDREGAAAAITREVYALGNSVVTYDCPGGGATHYAHPNFDCTGFLDRISGGGGNGQYVNCTDCATFVSTFANAVGCDLWQSRMGWSFDLNPILAIGSGTWQTACSWGGFYYHEVPWKDQCTAADAVYDACLQLDGDADPTSPPHVALLPTNIVFGTAGSGGYRDRLSPGGDCDPQPTTRRRRSVF